MFEDFLKKEEAIQLNTMAPVFGNYKPDIEKKLPELQVRYLTIRLTDPNDLLMLETVMTKSLHCQDNLENPGDIRVISEAGTFDKEGDYHVVVKYIEVKE